MLKLLRRASVVVLVLLLVLAATGYGVLRASLPRLDGARPAPGLAAPVRIERDALGVPTVSGHGRAEVAYGLGYLHAQDRLFQMDLLRRVSAGELAALLGPGLLATDRELRAHRFRSVALAAVAALPAAERAVLEAYAAGVNAGIADLGGRPFEYLLLRATPAPWRAEDSVLSMLTMFIDLQEPGGHTKVQRGLIRGALPPSVAAFVYAEATDWQAPLDGSRAAPPVIPAAADYDTRQLPAEEATAPARRAHARSGVGSNNWAVAGRRTTTGAALVANDMHLGIRVPNTWYRARLKVAATGTDITGVTLPGTPAVVTGSNGHVAWGFTNSYGDYGDVIAVEPDPAQPDHYLGPTGSAPFRHANERIEVNGASAVALDVVGTEWGPVIGHDHKGHALVLQWTAHEPEALNLHLLGLEEARTLEAALAVAATAGIPAQNFVAGDRDGHIGWTIAGQIPRRRGGDAAVPRSSTDPLVGFDGWVPPADHPRIVDPADGQIATANARVVGGEALAVIGDGGYDRGVRAARIQADLRTRGDRLTPRDMLAVQLDDAAVFLERWRALLVRLLDEPAIAGHARRAELRRVLGTWTGHAAVNDAAYRLVRAFRAELEQRVFLALIAPARAASPAFRFQPPASFEGPLWALVSAEPAHLVPPGATSWREAELLAADAAVAALDTECPALADCTWGRVNTMRIRHPLATAVPLLGALTDMPSEPLPGDEDMPRVIGPTFGSSERFGVSPGHEAEAYFHMPGGQSGHPLSPYFRAGYSAWAHGEPTPFLPGPTTHALTLTP